MSAIPDDLEPVLDAVAEERHRHDVELACAENLHAWLGAVEGDPIHGVVGKCPCGSSIYDLTGELIEP